MSQGSKRYFDEIGGGWDAMRKSFFPEQVRERALQVAGVRPGRLAADLGAGTGFVTEALVAAGLRVVAIDQSRVMLQALREKFPDRDAVTCHTGEAERLPLAEGSVDYAFANMYLHHVEDPAAAIRELHRILRPGGRAVITDLDAHDHDFLRTEHHDRWMGFQRDDVRGWFARAGFRDTTLDDLGATCCTTSDDGQSASIGIFIAAATR